MRPSFPLGISHFGQYILIHISEDGYLVINIINIVIIIDNVIIIIANAAQFVI